MAVLYSGKKMFKALQFYLPNHLLSPSLSFQSFSLYISGVIHNDIEIKRDLQSIWFSQDDTPSASRGTLVSREFQGFQLLLMKTPRNTITGVA